MLPVLLTTGKLHFNTSKLFLTVPVELGTKAWAMVTQPLSDPEEPFVPSDPLCIDCRCQMSHLLQICTIPVNKVKNKQFEAHSIFFFLNAVMNSDKCWLKGSDSYSIIDTYVDTNTVVEVDDTFSSFSF